MFQDLTNIQIVTIVAVIILMCYLYKQMVNRGSMESLNPTVWGTSPQPVTLTTPPQTRPTYTFYPTMDSSGSNIRQDIYIANNVPALKKACGQLDNCVGFSTDGSLKYLIRPRSKWKTWTTDPNKGLYVRN